ncbi:MAG: hypothetical protein ACT6S0_22285 [Roseateles sp.]|uniref:hypothetical protein n=1 Tax=Roseateles sp. TaxID=1971397 RepID=UPI0040370BC2
MNRATLHLDPDFGTSLVKARNALAFVLAVLTAPFRFATAVGRGFFRTVRAAFLGALGLALVGCVAYGLFRVVLYPLFH